MINDEEYRSSPASHHIHFVGNLAQQKNRTILPKAALTSRSTTCTAVLHMALVSRSSRKHYSPVIGAYELQKTLGQGAFSKVKLAIHTPTNCGFLS